MMICEVKYIASIKHTARNIVALYIHFRNAQVLALHVKVAAAVEVLACSGIAIWRYILLHSVLQVCVV